MPTAAATPPVTLGEIVVAYCKVCKSVIEHAVIAVKGKKPGRVQCRTCEDAHPFRAKAPAPRKKKVATSKTRGSASDDISYEDLIEGRDLSQAPKYSMSLPYADGDLINHAKFGVGLVTLVLVDRKIEVRFPEGKKLLVHNR